MGQRTEYTPGTFCWADLGTTDAGLARAFYGALLGWEPDGSSSPDPDAHSVMALDGDAVAGIYALGEDQLARGVPPRWLSYVSVEDVDGIAARVVELGGKVSTEPFDVARDGRAAVVADPQGATFALWAPRRFAGAALVNETGAMVLNQLNTNDPDGAARFYSELLGWEIDQVGSVPTGYWGITNAGSLNGGMMALQPQAPAPPHWLVYFTADDLEESAAVIADGGGAVVVPPMRIGSGRILVAHDPRFAFFALFEGDVDP